jgi:hypothetical protein
MRDNLWKSAFTDCGLEPPKSRTDLVTKQGDTVYVFKWTPELTRPQSAPPAQPRPAPPPEAGAAQPPNDVEATPQLIYTRKPLPTLGLLGRPPPSTTLGWQSTGPQLEERPEKGSLAAEEQVASPKRGETPGPQLRPKEWPRGREGQRSQRPPHLLGR